MPSTYSKIVGHSGRKKYDADNMMKASEQKGTQFSGLHSVNRKGLSIREVARKRKVTRSTLP